jgi:hypothetical protein
VRFGLAMARHRHSRGARLLALSIAPTLGVATAWLAGLFDLPDRSGIAHALSTAYAAACGWVLWRVVHGINVRFGWYRHWVRHPFGETLLPAALNVLIASVGAAVVYLVWLVATGVPHDHEFFSRLLFIAAGATAVSNLGYRVSFVHALRVRAVRRIAKLERVAARAQMSALKAQLDPHFLANSLNVFCHLAESRSDAATRFADNLSWIYRYVIENGQRDFVRLDAELEFVDRYVGLLRLRFGAGIDLRIRDLSNDRTPRWLPPLAMQTLIENAVKHNAFSADEPLVFTVTLNAASIEASNPVRARSLTTRGEGLGLANLANRVRLLTGLTVRVDRRLEQFRVTVPLVAGTVT